MYNSMLTTEMLEGMELIGFTDDVALVAQSWRIEHVANIVNESLGIVNDWMSEH